MTFAFDERYAMFDVTPVENQFILEYLAGAKGDYVKVYLYGLLCCYHPRKEMDIASMSRELELTEDVILAAFRYWERRHLVCRISDNPPAWQFVNIKQLNLNNMGDGPEQDYARFCREVQSAFDGERELHGSELSACYEWKEDMGLNTEVIILLLKHMSLTRGKNFRIRDAEKTAILLADEKAFTGEDAAAVLGRDEVMVSGLRKVLRKLGMRFNPSDANLNLYRKWREEWNFTQEAIEDACDRTGTSTPSLALVDSILEQTYRNSGSKSRKLDRADLEASEEKRTNLKQVLKEIGQYGTATPAQQKLYDRMAEMYPQEIILLAADAAFEAKKPITYMDRLLTNWSDKGIRTPEAAKQEQKNTGAGDRQKTAKTSVKTIPAQQYAQRDYEGEQEDAMRRMLSGVRNGGKSHA